MSSCFFINHDNMIAFGRWLAEQRKTRFWSQSVLAEKLDVSQNSVSRWETGEAFPSPSHLQKIAELFGVTPDDILQIARQGSLTEPEPAGYCIAETNAMPDPDREKKKVIRVYDPTQHHYEKEKPIWNEILPGHFVYGNERELDGYRKEIG